MQQIQKNGMTFHKWRDRLEQGFMKILDDIES
jgi:hypothetical protein